MNSEGHFEVKKDPFRLTPDDEEDIENDWYTFAENLIGEKQNERETKVTQLRKAVLESEEIDLFRDRTDILTDGYITRYLRAANWNVDDAFKVFCSYISMANDFGHIGTKSLPSKLDHVWRCSLTSIPEARDKFGRRVFVMRMGQWDPDTVGMDDFTAAMYVLFELVSREVKTQIAGVTVVNDCAGFSFKHIRNISFEQLRCMSLFMTGGFPLWFRKIHIVNQPRIFSILHNMTKPLLEDRVRDNIVFHGSSLTSLHEEVDPFLLPTNLGGSNELDTTAIDVAKQLESHYEDLSKMAQRTK